MRSALPARSPTRASIWLRAMRIGVAIAPLVCLSALSQPCVGELAQPRVVDRGHREHAPPGQRDDALGAGAAVQEDHLAGAGERRVEGPADVVLDAAQDLLLTLVAGVYERHVAHLEPVQELVVGERGAVAPDR